MKGTAFAGSARQARVPLPPHNLPGDPFNLGVATLTGKPGDDTVDHRGYATPRDYEVEAFARQPQAVRRIIDRLQHDHRVVVR